jgi:nitroimidazol reductase NimA-like FMN-containing flavoprotein (pyridoxamine 5'-phosphate oxidase superfamily)
VSSGKLEVLSAEECLARLGQAKVGRVGVCIGGTPEIFPVNFAILDGAIVFRTGEGTKLHAATRRNVLAFEVDDFDDEVQHGWSVLVTGPSDEITDPDDIHAARNLLSGTWVPADRYHVLTIVPERMTGRRITERD